jgi:hypothetical protein
MQSTSNTHTLPAKRRPIYRLWLVEDGPEGQPQWTALTGLWRTRKGNGFTGSLTQPVAATGGRLVVLPASFKPDAEKAQPEQTGGAS